MNDVTSQLLYFYNRHPISRDIILAKLQASRGHLDNLCPEELSPHDQDHYGGLKATDELARQAQIGSGTLVADFCAEEPAQGIQCELALELGLVPELRRSANQPKDLLHIGRPHEGLVQRCVHLNVPRVRNPNCSVV